MMEIKERFILKRSFKNYLDVKVPRYKNLDIYIHQDGFRILVNLEGPYGWYGTLTIWRNYNEDDSIEKYAEKIKSFIDSREILFRQFRPQNIWIHPGYYFDDETFSIVSVAAGGAS